MSRPEQSCPSIFDEPVTRLASRLARGAFTDVLGERLEDCAEYQELVRRAALADGMGGDVA